MKIPVSLKLEKTISYIDREDRKCYTLFEIGSISSVYDLFGRRSIKSLFKSIESHFFLFLCEIIEKIK